MAFHYSNAEASPDGKEVVVSVLGGPGDDVKVGGSPAATLSVNGTTVTPGSITKISQNRVKLTGFSGGTVIYRGDAVTLTVTGGITDDDDVDRNVSNFPVVNLSRATPAAPAPAAVPVQIRTPEDAGAAIVALQQRVAALEAGRSDLVLVPVEDLAAGADVAALPVFAHPAAYTVIAAGLLLQGASAGVDAGNTVVVNLKSGSDVVATKTYGATPPTANAYNALTLDATKVSQAAAAPLTLDVTQGTTADLPACVLVLQVRKTAI